MRMFGSRFTFDSGGSRPPQHHGGMATGRLHAGVASDKWCWSSLKISSVKRDPNSSQTRAAEYRLKNVTFKTFWSTPGRF